MAHALRRMTLPCTRLRFLPEKQRWNQLSAVSCQLSEAVISFQPSAFSQAHAVLLRADSRQLTAGFLELKADGREHPVRTSLSRIRSHDGQLRLSWGARSTLSSK